MIKSNKLLLVFEGLPLSTRNDVASLAATFLNRPLLILGAAANLTHLAIILHSNTRIRCQIKTLREACTFEEIIPSVYTAKLNIFKVLTKDWPEKWPVPKKKLAESCTELMNGLINMPQFFRQQPSQIRFFDQYQNSLLLYRQMSNGMKPLPKKRGHFIIGPARSGKTTAARDILLKNTPYYVKDLTTGTFDQYCGQSGILFDEIGLHSPLLPILKTITDIVPARVNGKHDSFLVNFEIIVVTTTHSLLELTHNTTLRQALVSRFHFWTMGDSYSLLEM